MHRFYLPSLDFQNDNLVIEDARLTAQITKVLRMKEGHYFHVFNEKGEWLVHIDTIEKKKLKVNQISEVQNFAEPKLKVSLYHAIPKKQALFELVIQKASELGVHDIFPLITERTENRRLHKMDRLQMIAMEATEQCGGLNVPKIHLPVDFKKIVNKIDNGFLAYENEQEKSLSDYLSIVKKNDSLAIFVGPEGGFSENEVELAKLLGIKTFSLGKRILRTETAGMVALSLVLLKD